MPIDTNELEGAPDWFLAALEKEGSPDHVMGVLDALWRAYVEQTPALDCPNLIDMDLHNRSYIAAYEGVLGAEAKRRLANVDDVIERRWGEISQHLDPRQVAQAIAEYGEQSWWTGRFPAHV